MAHVDVEMACGHKETITVFGCAEERQARIHYLENNGICQECLEKIREETYKKAALKASEHGWIPLSGTEKQIHWAEELRSTKIPLLTEFLMISNTFGNQNGEKCLEFWTSQKNASLWINCRNYTAREMMQHYLQTKKDSAET